MMKPIAASSEMMPLSRSSLPALAPTEPTDGIARNGTLTKLAVECGADFAIEADKNDFKRVVFGTTEALHLVRLDVDAAQDFVDLGRLGGLSSAGRLCRRRR